MTNKIQHFIQNVETNLDNYPLLIGQYREITQNVVLQMADRLSHFQDAPSLFNMDKVIEINGKTAAKVDKDDDSYATKAHCPKQGKLTIIQHFDSIYALPIIGLPITVISDKDPKDTHTQTTDANGKVEFTGLNDGTRYRVVVDQNPSKGDVEALFSTYQDLTGELQRWLRQYWDGSFKEQWLAKQHRTDMERAVDIAATFANAIWDNLTEFWHQVEALCQLITHPKEAFAKLKADASKFASDVEHAINGSTEMASKALLFASDELAMFLLAHAVIDFFTMLPQDTIPTALVNMGAGALMDLLFGMLGGAILSLIAGPAVGMGYLAAKIGTRLVKIIEPIKNMLQDFLTLISQCVDHAQAFRKIYLNGILNTHALKNGEKLVSIARGKIQSLLTAISEKIAQKRNQPENLAGSPCQCNSGTITEGCPVSMVTGEELLSVEDATLPGPLPFVFSRLYRTSAAEIQQGCGYGWSHPLSQHLTFDGDEVVWHDNENRLTRFPLPNKGMPAVINPLAESAIFLGKNDDEYLLTGTEGEVYHFTRKGQQARLTGLSDSYDNQLIVRYRRDNRPEAIVTPMGTGLWLVYDGERISQLEMRTRLPDSEQWRTERVLMQYHYNDADQLIAARNTADEGEDYCYDDENVITLRRMAGGVEFGWEWQGKGKHVRAVKHWSNTGFLQDYEWNDTNGSVTVKHSDGSSEVYVHDNNARLIEQVDPDGAVTKKEYNDDGLLICETDPLGNQTRYAYNDQQERQAIIRPDGTSVRFVHHHGHVKQVIDGKREWAFTHNRQGDIVSKTDPLGNETRYSYTAHGKLNEIHYSDGSVHRLRWNKLGMLIGEQFPDGSDIHYRHDIFGRITQEQSPTGGITRYLWDDADRLVQITQPSGQRKSFSYNAYGKVTEIIDENGDKTRYLYEPNSHLVSQVIHPDGTSLAYRYDNIRRFVSCITNERGEQYLIDYHNNGLVKQETTFDGRRLRYEYDLNGNLSAKTEIGLKGTELTTTYSRDAMGRLLSKALPDGSDVQYEYDQYGQLTAVEDGVTPLAWDYDPLGRLTAEHQGWASQYYRYDAQGQLTHWQLPDHNQLQYAYHPGGSLDRIHLNGQQLTRHHFQHGLERERQQGALSSQFDYDDQGRLQAHRLQQQNKTRVERRYHYHATGNLAQTDDSRYGSTYYDYDPLDRLTSVRGALTERFVHDPAGNLLEQTLGSRPGQTITRVSGNQLLMQGDRFFEYDEFGRLSTERRGKHQSLVTHYEYDCQHRLVSATLPDGSQAAYRYDAFGRRVHKQVTDKVGVRSATEFIWQGDNLIAENKDYQAYQTYLYQPGSFKPLALLKGKGSSCEVFHYHLDHLGTPTDLTDEQGNTVWQAQYRSYGNIARQHVEDIPNPLRFQGQYFDSETGLHYNRHRYYSPDTGRFITADPIGLAGGLNSYRYAPNPVNWIDPLGLTNLPPNGPCKNKIIYVDSNGVASPRLDQPLYVDTHGVAKSTPGVIYVDQQGMAHFALSKLSLLSRHERQEKIKLKSEQCAERWVKRLEKRLNKEYKNLGAHFVDKHGPDIPFDPDLKMRAVDGRHPRTGKPKKSKRPDNSSQFNDWKTQMHIINEATSRHQRGLDRYTGQDNQKNPIVEGYDPNGVGRGYSQNRKDPNNPRVHLQMKGWRIRFNNDYDEPFTGYPQK